MDVFCENRFPGRVLGVSRARAWACRVACAYGALARGLSRGGGAGAGSRALVRASNEF